MGKRRRIQGPRSQPQSSLLDDAFNIENEMLAEIKAKHVHVTPQPEEAQAPSQLQEISAPKRERMQLVELKQLASDPEIIEWHDTHAPDPLFLAKLKSHPGAVPVPQTWQGREFRSKYAISAPYKLPKNVYETGIVQQRNVNEDKSSEKQMAKNRVIPKLGTLDLDLVKLKAAFFKRNEKPHLYRFGQVYSPKQEQEIDFSDLKPGTLSDRLKQALGIKRDDAAPWLPLIQKHNYQLSYAQVCSTSGQSAPPLVHWGEIETRGNIAK